ncbi:MAG TPA: alpha-amylase family glycosyl hydrolase [Tabrizicola sp.]|nr:alpha-amylase family glycosyl hydrolase [Tabrizicola sp.]
MDTALYETGTRQVWGAHPIRDGQWDIALWAPSAGPVLLHLGDRPPFPMSRGEDGVHRARVRADEGTRYAFSTAGTPPFADPASFQQEGGVEDWSILRDPLRFRRGSAEPPRRPFDESAICELHIGTFTHDGTFRAAAESRELPRLADIGITVIELMPVGQFPGTRGWGYDSVLPWAPQHSYGTPEDLAALVDRAHGLGLSVVLDVVFNHFGPKGSMLGEICPEFFLDSCNDWGRKIDFSRPEVRAYFIGCAMHWLRAYNLDGLRFDAVHTMEDKSDPHIMVELAQTIRQADFGRPVHLVAEDSSNRVGWYDPAAGLIDATWDDDYHHALHVLLTGESFGYYKDFTKDPHADLRLALRDGQTLQGQHRAVGEEKGEPSGHLPPRCFVNFNLNHDQSGNRPKGERLISLIGADRALVAHAFLLSAPYTPLIFMGEEIGSHRPFPWFADYDGTTAKKMRAGRVKQFEDMPGKGRDMQDPFDPRTHQLAWPYAKPEPRDADLWLKVTADVLKLRREQLLPLFRSGRNREFEITRLGDRGLCALWHFSDGTVQADVAFDAGDPEPEIPTGFQVMYQLGQSGAPRFRLGLLTP